MGKEYAVSQAKISRQTGLQGSLEVWENPLVSSPIHAADLADWVGDYLKADREYDLNTAGIPGSTRMIWFFWKISMRPIFWCGFTTTR